MAAAFCVFGISKGVCRKLAEKQVEEFVIENRTDDNPSGTRRYLSVSEWGDKVARRALELFNIAEKVGKISPELDAPQFCRDWLAAGPAETRNTKIMVRGPKLDKNGEKVVRNGVVVLTWLEYDERTGKAKVAAK